MRCKYCGKEMEITMVDVKNEKQDTPIAKFILKVAVIIAILAALVLLFLLFLGGQYAKDVWNAIAGLVDCAIAILILWRVFCCCITTIVLCSIYINLVPYKVIAVKKYVCKNCGTLRYTSDPDERNQ